MPRIRLVVAAIGIAVAVPIALLVQRAVQSTVLERELRHRAIAERLFDEMERALSDFLRREEARPFEGYAQAEPASPFVLGYFEVAPDGRVGVRADAPARAAVESAAARLRGGAPEAHENAPAQIAGTTARVVTEGRMQAAAPPEAKQEERETSAYDALNSLNKAVQERAERQKTKSAVGDERDEPMARAFRDDKDAGALAGALVLDAALPSMNGRAVDGDRLVLARTVVHGAQAYRQGLVVDVGRLGTFLRAQALGDDVLAAHATVSFATRLGAAASPAGDYVYQHRFADPFADVSARVALRALPGAGDARYVYALSAALLVAAVLGLLALHRMVTVALAFAERRSNFVAAVSHELKTPLTAIRMYGEMLRDGIVPSEEKRQEYYRHITAESERLSRLINNVLEFSRLEKGNRDVTLVSGSIAPVLREAAELVRPHVEAEGFTLRLDVDGDLPPVRFERDALLQVLFNLVDNAVKYACDGAERRIVVRARADGDGARVAVVDSGPGVPRQHLGHVFEPFYRGERELTRRHRGTGLGLALVRGLVERMGGRVTGRNVDGGGFEVTIDLPRAASAGEL